MSRIGRLPVTIPSGVKTTIEGGRIWVEGPKGKLNAPIPSGIEVAMEDGALRFTRADETGPVRAKHGLARVLAFNCVKGVTEGFSKKLQIVGVGYRVKVEGRKLEFALGYSHPVIFDLPEGITAEAEVEKASKSHLLTIFGIDKQLVGQVAADIRALRSPEPYKGKGIRYFGEMVRIKAGKAGK